MNSKARTFGIMGAIFIIAREFIKIIGLIIDRLNIFGYSFYSSRNIVISIVEFLLFIVLAVFLFIGKNKILVAAGYGTLLTFWLITSTFDPIFLIYYLSVSAVITLSFLNIKTVKYLFYIPAVLYLIDKIYFLAKWGFGFKYFLYNWSDFFASIIFIEIDLFICGYFAYSIKNKIAKPTPVYNFSQSYNINEAQYSSALTTKLPSENETVCPNCQSIIKAGSAFCTVCGQQLQTDKICPNCGQKISAQALFCNYCGTKMN